MQSSILNLNCFFNISPHFVVASSSPKCKIFRNWLVLSDQQMSTRWPANQQVSDQLARVLPNEEDQFASKKWPFSLLHDMQKGRNWWLSAIARKPRYHPHHSGVWRLDCSYQQTKKSPIFETTDPFFLNQAVGWMKGVGGCKARSRKLPSLQLT